MREEAVEADRPKLGRPPKVKEIGEEPLPSFLLKKSITPDTSGSAAVSVNTEATSHSNVNNGASTSSAGRVVSNSNVGGNASAVVKAPTQKLKVAVTSSPGASSNVGGKTSSSSDGNASGKFLPARSTRNSKPVYK